MKTELWLIGKNESYLLDGFEMFSKRISRYVSFEIKYFSEPKKGNTPELIKEAESKLILSRLDKRDYLIILDENGKKYSSEKFASMLEKLFSTGNKKIVFLIGGAYGFDTALRERANQSVSLSEMTFSHQIVRLIFAEQLYRAFTIIHHEPYHHS